MADRAAPSGYLAIIHQDLDRLGRQLDNNRDRAWHEQVSAALAGLANAQIDSIEALSVLGRVVYAGGDDLLALVPAEHALTAARSARALVAEHLGDVLSRPDVSCSVVFMPSAFPFQRALGLARDALKRSKDQGRNRLTVQVLSGGTVRSSVTTMWTNDPIDRLLRLAASGLAGAQLAAGVERQRRQLGDTGLLRDEVRRLVGRSEALVADGDQVVDDLFSTMPGCDALGIVELAHLVHKLGGFGCR